MAETENKRTGQPAGDQGNPREAGVNVHNEYSKPYQDYDDGLVAADSSEASKEVASNNFRAKDQQALNHNQADGSVAKFASDGVHLQPGGESVLPKVSKPNRDDQSIQGSLVAGPKQDAMSPSVQQFSQNREAGSSGTLERSGSGAQEVDNAPATLGSAVTAAVSRVDESQGPDSTQGSLVKEAKSDVQRQAEALARATTEPAASTVAPGNTSVPEAGPNVQTGDEYSKLLPQPKATIAAEVFPEYGRQEQAPGADQNVLKKSSREVANSEAPSSGITNDASSKVVSNERDVAAKTDFVVPSKNPVTESILAEQTARGESAKSNAGLPTENVQTTSKLEPKTTTPALPGTPTPTNKGQHESAGTAIESANIPGSSKTPVTASERVPPVSPAKVEAEPTKTTGAEKGQSTSHRPPDTTSNTATDPGKGRQVEGTKTATPVAEPGKTAGIKIANVVDGDQPKTPGTGKGIPPKVTGGADGVGPKIDTPTIGAGKGILTPPGKAQGEGGRTQPTTNQIIDGGKKSQSPDGRRNPPAKVAGDAPHTENDPRTAKPLAIKQPEGRTQSGDDRSPRGPATVIGQGQKEPTGRIDGSSKDQKTIKTQPVEPGKIEAPGARNPKGDGSTVRPNISDAPLSPGKEGTQKFPPASEIKTGKQNTPSGDGSKATETASTKTVKNPVTGERIPVEGQKNSGVGEKGSGKTDQKPVKGDGITGDGQKNQTTGPKSFVDVALGMIEKNKFPDQKPKSQTTGEKGLENTIRNPITGDRPDGKKNPPAATDKGNTIKNSEPTTSAPKISPVGEKGISTKSPPTGEKFIADGPKNVQAGEKNPGTRTPVPVDRVPADRIPADRVPADRVPADRNQGLIGNIPTKNVIGDKNVGQAQANQIGGGKNSGTTDGASSTQKGPSGNKETSPKAPTGKDSGGSANAELIQPGPKHAGTKPGGARIVEIGNVGKQIGTQREISGGKEPSGGTKKNQHIQPANETIQIGKTQKVTPGFTETPTVRQTNVVGDKRLPNSPPRRVEDIGTKTSDAQPKRPMKVTEQTTPTRFEHPETRLMRILKQRAKPDPARPQSERPADIIGGASKSILWQQTLKGDASTFKTQSAPKEAKAGGTPAVPGSKAGETPAVPGLKPAGNQELRPAPDRTLPVSMPAAERTLPVSKPGDSKNLPEGETSELASKAVPKSIRDVFLKFNLSIPKRAFRPEITESGNYVAQNFESSQRLQAFISSGQLKAIKPSDQEFFYNDHTNTIVEKFVEEELDEENEDAQTQSSSQSAANSIDKLAWAKTSSTQESVRKMYMVKEADTITSIAVVELNDESLAELIVEINRLLIKKMYDPYLRQHVDTFPIGTMILLPNNKDVDAFRQR